MIVAIEHDDVQPECVEFLDRFGGGGFDRVGDGEDSRRLATDSDEQHSLAAFCKFHDRGFQRLKAGDIFVPQEIRLANQSRDSSDGRSNPFGQRVSHQV